MRSLSFDDPIRSPASFSALVRLRGAVDLPPNYFQEIRNPPTAERSATQARGQGKKKRKRKSLMVEQSPTAVLRSISRLTGHLPLAFANITEGSVEYVGVHLLCCCTVLKL